MCADSSRLLSIALPYSWTGKAKKANCFNVSVLGSHIGRRPAKFGVFFFFADPKPASIFAGVVAGTMSGQGYQGDHLFFSSGFGETLGGLAGEFQCTDWQGSVSEVQAFFGGACGEHRPAPCS